MGEIQDPSNLFGMLLILSVAMPLAMLVILILGIRALYSSYEDYPLSRGELSKNFTLIQKSSIKLTVNFKNEESLTWRSFTSG